MKLENKKKWDTPAARGPWPQQRPKVPYRSAVAGVRGGRWALLVGVGASPAQDPRG